MELTVRGLRYLNNGPYDLFLYSGCCIGLCGPSGTGKSQFCRAITELLPSTGEVSLDGQPRESFSSPEWRRKIGFLPAEPAWWYDDVWQHFQPGTDKTALVRECTQLGLSGDILEWQIGRLSTGERQRLALLRCLAMKPAFLLLDEPTSALGAEHTEMVERFLRKKVIDAGGGILWISHDANQLERVADQCYEMSKEALTLLEHRSFCSS